MRQFVSISALVFLLFAGMSCSILEKGNLPYLSQAIRGHLRIMNARTSIEKMLRDPDLDPETRNKLQLVLDVRRFASQELGLPENKSYTRLSQISGAYLGWNVYCAPRYSMEPVTWCFPIAGCVVYRGYFAKDDALAFADGMEQQGYDVYVGPFNAYSTLGWYNDPILSTHLRYDSVQLASIIIHELAHQQLYVAGDSRFSEAFAVTVERAGIRQWLTALGRHDQLKETEEMWVLEDLLVARVLEAKEALHVLYANPSIETKQSGKDSLFSSLQADLMHLQGYTQEQPRAKEKHTTLNNAALVPVSTYHALLPNFTALLDSLNHHLPTFYEHAKTLGKLTPTERHHRLSQAF